MSTYLKSFINRIIRIIFLQAFVQHSLYYRNENINLSMNIEYEYDSSNYEIKYFCKSGISSVKNSIINK